MNIVITKTVQTQADLRESVIKLHKRQADAVDTILCYAIMSVVTPFLVISALTFQGTQMFF